MKLSPALALLSLVLASGFGCRIQDDDLVPRGDVAIVVIDQRGAPVPDARVYTLPTSRIEDLTDAFGTVSIRGVESASYDLYAEFGDAVQRTVLFVGPGQLSTTRLQLPLALPGGGNPDGSPRLFFSAPEQTRTYAAGEAVPFSATASDDATPNEAIVIRWVSNVDGVLGEGTADRDGRLLFERVLTPGFHQLTVTATDADGDFSELRSSVNVGGVAPIRLEAPDPDEDGVRLRWNRTPSPDFRAYLLQRGGGDCGAPGFDEWRTLATLRTAADTAFFDDTPAPASAVACYRLVLQTTADAAAAVSNTVTYAPATPGLLGFRPSAAAAHPTRDMTVYLVDARAQRIVRYAADDATIEADAQLSGGLGQPTLGDAGNGLELFVPSDNGTVFVLDPLSLRLRIVINTVTGAGSVAAFEDGFVVVSGLSDAPAAGQYRSYSRATGQLLASNLRSLAGGALRRVPGQREAVGATLAGAAVYFAFDTDGDFVTEASRPGGFETSASPEVLAVAPDGSAFVSSARANGFDVSPQLSFRGRTDFGPRGVLSAGFSESGNEVYGGLAAGEDVDDAPGIAVAAFPSRLRKRVIPTRGYVQHLVRLADGRFASVETARADDTDREAIVRVVE